ncbi:MAG TPA: hypothetical protein DCM86_06245 [Verrucomicrobiales bacterium]|nr:hypothetical protein [Verrucomicrobiales bacterium]
MFNDGVQTPVFDTAVNLGSLGEAANATYSGAVHPVPTGLVADGGTAASMKGGASVRVAFNADLNPSESFTVEAWLKPAVSFTDSTLTCALSSGHFASPRAGWLIYQSAGGFNFRTYNQNGTATSLNITGGGPLVAGSWYHVVAVFDGTQGIVYVNGTEVARGDSTGYIAPQDGVFAVGMRADGSFGWSGTADEPAFYSVALSPEQILAHYTAGSTAAPAKSYEATVLADQPLGFWRLNEPVFVSPVAKNDGSLGAAANGSYRGAAVNASEAPKGPAFTGFEDDNTSLDLDGASGYVGTALSLLNDLSQFTITGWVRRGADQASRTGLWGQNDRVEVGYIDNNTIQVWTDANLDVRPNPFPNEEWDHLAVVCDGPTITVYTNGVLAGTRSQTLPANNSFLFNIGGGGVFDGGGNYFKGQIDEVAVFAKPLSASDICNQYGAAVPTPPSISTQPLPVTIYAGDTIVASVEACGSPDLSYHWFRGTTEVAVTSVPTLSLPGAKETDSGTYSVSVRNDVGVADSDGFDIVVLAASAPIIEVAPVSFTRYEGATAALKVKVTGTPPFGYQWQFKGANISGATSDTLLFSSLKATDAGNYRVVVTNPIGSTPSADAVLTVLVPQPGSYAASIVGTHPTAYWPLNETAGPTAFDYAGGLDGTYNNYAFGTEAPFDGTSSFVGTPATLNNDGAFTLSGWVRRGGHQGDRTGLFGQNDLVEFGFIDDGTIEAYINAVGNSIDIASPIADGEWAFLALTGDAGKVRLYVNGVEAANLDSGVATYGSSAFTLNIGGGGIFDDKANYFLGAIHDVALHTRALTSSEVCSLYQAGSGIVATVKVESGGATIEDVKPAGTPHTAQGKAAHWLAADGARQGVLEFSATGGSQVVIPADPDFNTTTGTFAFWVQTSGTTGPGNDGAILFDRRTSAGDVLVQNDDGTLFVQANGGSGTVNSFSSTGAIADGAWHHVAYVYDQANGGATTLYIDGAASGTQAASGAWKWIPDQQIEIGRSHDGYWKAFNGKMDDFRIYNRPLTDTEIASVAKGDGATPVAADALVARYSFDRIPGGVTLRWECGVLQATDELKSSGTLWTDVTDAVSPYSVGATPGAHYYRLRP